jgi:hypothetical protein
MNLESLRVLPSKGNHELPLAIVYKIRYNIVYNLVRISSLSVVCGYHY